jgi:PKD repeat protein
VGSSVTLDGCHSFDAESDSLTYAWSIGDAPIESGGFLTGSDTCAPVFVADAPGYYVFELVVRDGFGLPSLPDTVTITASSNAQPKAEAGPAQTVHVGTIAMLDGSASSDPDGDLITYAWSFLSRPDGSKATLSGAGTVNPTFRPDLQGSYDVKLVVSDSSGLQSLPDTVTVNTSNSPPKADAGPDQAITAIGTVVNLDAAQRVVYPELQEIITMLREIL